MRLSEVTNEDDLRIELYQFLKVACRINQKLKSLEQHVVQDVGSLDLATQCL